MVETIASPQDLNRRTLLASWELPGRPEFVAVARAFLRVLLAEHPQFDIAEWLLSEVFSNSVQHSASGTHETGTVFVGLAVSPSDRPSDHSSGHPGGRIRLEVTDEGGLTAPQDRSGDLEAESGRGWHLVRTLAEDCGSEPGTHGRITWFTVGPTAEPSIETGTATSTATGTATSTATGAGTETETRTGSGSGTWTGHAT
jgi:anti-sigma regulatory factor (Ser/Thr protein kinase)